MYSGYRRMETASNVLGYIPWVVAIVPLLTTGSFLLTLALFAFVGAPLFSLAVILGHIARLKLRKSEGRFESWGPSVSGLSLGYFGLAVAAVFFVSFHNSDLLGGRSAYEASAIGSLRTINRACEAYKSAHPAAGFPENLAELPYSEKTPGAEWQIDPKIAGGERYGYRFTYIPKKDGNGQIETYEVFADPVSEGRSGTRHFFVDQSGIFRFATKTRANSQSEILQ